MDVSSALGAFTEPVALDGPKVHHLPQWGGFGDPKRMDVITRIAKMRGRDPRIASLAVSIIKEAGAKPRDYKAQAAALLDWVQHKLYYVNEPGERLQDPTYTLKVGYGDCDDLVIMLGSLLESIRLPWKVVISGNKGRKKVRYHHGEKFPGGEKKGYNWSHIYMMIGDRPFTPSRWYYAETTVRGAPLGWDVVDGDASMFPELQANYGATMTQDQAEYGAMMAPNDNSNGTALPSLPSTLVTSGVGSNLSPTPKGMIKAGSRAWNQRHSWKQQQNAPQGRSVSVRQGERQATMVAVVVIAPNGRVLALHRGPSTQWMPGKWDLPGGKTNGVPARKAALQILRKETGIVAKPSRLRACSAVYHPSAGTSVFYAYKLSSKDKKPLVQIAKKEHQGWRWVGPQTLRKAYQTAPYVDIAFRACFKPRSLKTYTKKGWKGTPAKPRYISLDTNAEQARLASTPSIADKIFASPNNTNSDYKSIANLGGYGAFTMPLALQKEYYGLPLWGLLAAGGAAYYFYAKK